MGKMGAVRQERAFRGISVGWSWGYMFWGRERQALHTAPETGLHSAFYCKGRKRYEKVTWSDWHFRKSQRKDRTLAQKEMEGGGSNGDAEGETSLGLDLEGGKMLK